MSLSAILVDDDPDVRMAEQRGGRIQVESAVGVGTCFRFTLPLASTQAAEARDPFTPGA